MRSVFTQYIMLVTRINHVIHLYTFIHSGFDQIDRMLHNYHIILHAMNQEQFTF